MKSNSNFFELFVIIKSYVEGRSQQSINLLDINTNRRRYKTYFEPSIPHFVSNAISGSSFTMDDKAEGNYKFYGRRW